jgi:hypothetical protein
MNVVTLSSHNPLPGKRYLGDGVYADFDGFHVVLTTEHGESRPNNIIYLEPDVIEQLMQYLQLLIPKG